MTDQQPVLNQLDLVVRDMDATLAFYGERHRRSSERALEVTP